MAMLTGLASVGATAPPPAGAPGASPQEAEVTGVVLDPNTRQPIVLLQGKRDRRPLALAIGPFEANGIAIALQGVTPPRPLTHDLFLNVLGDLRASLKRIVVTDLRDDIFYAQLHLEAGGTQRTIDARPSDAIALALRARVPILVEDRVFEKAERIPPKGGSAPTLDRRARELDPDPVAPRLPRSGPSSAGWTTWSGSSSPSSATFAAAWRSSRVRG
jgi:bifunctional DNase/RNase